MVTICYRDGTQETVFDAPDGSKPTVRSVYTTSGSVAEYIVTSGSRSRELRIPSSAVNCIESIVGES